MSRDFYEKRGVALTRFCGPEEGDANRAWVQVTCDGYVQMRKADAVAMARAILAEFGETVGPSRLVPTKSRAEDA